MSALENIYREDCQRAGVGKFYDDLIAKGSSPGFAAMLALRSPPNFTGSDRAYMEGDVIHHGLQGMPKFMQEQFVTKAKKAGIDIQGKIYKGGLADQRGAACPDAWVGGVDEMMAVARKNNLTVTRGDRIVHKGEPQPEPPDIPLGPSALKELAKRYVAENPEWIRKPEELAEVIVQNHGNPSRIRNKEKSVAKLQKSLEIMEQRMEGSSAD